MTGELRALIARVVVQYPEHGRALRLIGAAPVSVRVEGSRVVVRLRHALRGEGPAGSLVAEVVQPDGSSELLR